MGQALIDSHNGKELTEYRILIIDRFVSTMLFNWQFVHAEFIKGRFDEDSMPLGAWRKAFRGEGTSETDYWPEMTEYWEKNRI